jgi:hypothetical protein
MIQFGAKYGIPKFIDPGMPLRSKSAAVTPPASHGFCKLEVGTGPGFV